MWKVCERGEVGRSGGVCFRCSVKPVTLFDS
uniref:Uncharacterized protein n=1 Tax=Anguilla anguilla TaxID=7936 RepID=A0A0E9W534_ANGAN